MLTFARSCPLVSDDGLGHLAEHLLLLEPLGGAAVQRSGGGDLLLLLLQPEGGTFSASHVPILPFYHDGGGESVLLSSLLVDPPPNAGRAPHALLCGDHGSGCGGQPAGHCKHAYVVQVLPPRKGP